VAMSSLYSTDVPVHQVGWAELSELARAIAEALVDPSPLTRSDARIAQKQSLEHHQPAFQACSPSWIASPAVAFDEGRAERIRAGSATTPTCGSGRCSAGSPSSTGAHGVRHRRQQTYGERRTDAWADALAEPHAREMDFTGRSLKSMVYVGVDGFAEDEHLGRRSTAASPTRAASPPSGPATGAVAL
jgi:hypothetical protein